MLPALKELSWNNVLMSMIQTLQTACNIFKSLIYLIESLIKSKQHPIF